APPINWSVETENLHLHWTTLVFKGRVTSIDKNMLDEENTLFNNLTSGVDFFGLPQSVLLESGKKIPIENVVYVLHKDVTEN
ncbi:MAG: hypothetical protein D6733_01200, partial [Methanobacteriota archaeon]